MDPSLPEVFDVPHGGRIVGEVRAPGSKSHAIRALLAAALAKGDSTLTALPEADDVRAVVGALRAIGIDVRVEADRALVRGCDGILPVLDQEEVRVDLRGSGTGLRLLASVCCLGRGPYVLDGDDSLRSRPLGGAVEAVEALGCRAETADGRPPLRVSGGPVHRLPDDVRPPPTATSSQPLSGFVIAASVLPGAPRTGLRLDTDAVSLEYVRLTLRVLREFGATGGGIGSAGLAGQAVPTVVPADGPLRATELAVDGDWSSAAFLLGAAAATGGELRLGGVRFAGGQPDEAIVGILRSMGARIEADDASATCRGGPLRGVEVALGGAPDLAPLVGALGCVAEGNTIVKDAPHLRIKESDRIASTVAAARAIGCRAEERDDGFVIHGGGATGGTVDPCGDHRLAMAFAVAGLAIPGVRIRDPGCVAKSYPGFWDDLTRLITP